APELGKKERAIARFIDDNPQSLARMSITEIANYLKVSVLASKNTSLPFSLLCITPPVNVKTKLARQNDMKCYLGHIL
ncbi:hypothetical protein ACSLO7_29960, partial [Klebsiella pneumoniae]